MSISNYLSVHLMDENEAKGAIRANDYETPSSLWEKKVLTTVTKISRLLENISKGCEHTLSDEEISTLIELNNAIGVWDFESTSMRSIGILALKRFPRGYMDSNEVRFSSGEEGDFLSLILPLQAYKNSSGKGKYSSKCAVFLLSVDGVSLCNALSKKIVVSNDTISSSL